MIGKTGRTGISYFRIQTWTEVDNLDQIIISGLVSGEKKAFDLLFQQNYSNLCHYAESMVHDHDVAEDVVQDLFAELWINRERLAIRSSLRSYLMRSAFNACLDYMKHLKIRKKFRSEVMTGMSLLTEGDVPDTEILKKIESSIDELPEQCRKIFKLSRFDNLKYREIARVLNISENTVDTQIRRALNKLRHDLRDYLISFFFIIHSIF